VDIYLLRTLLADFFWARIRSPLLTSESPSVNVLLMVTKNANFFSFSISITLTLMTLLFPHLARAHSYRPTSLDEVLLGTDAILVGTVVSLDALDLDSDRTIVAVTLGSTRVINSRWPVPSRFTFNVSAEFGRDGVVKPLRYQPPLRVGERFLLLLRGGPWNGAPVTRTAEAIYVVSDSGVSCPGGQIYGVDSTGFICSVPELQVGLPLTEDELSQKLAASLQAARLRRPEAARSEDLQSRTLLPMPEKAQ